MRTITTIAALLLAGCATCEQHPVACGIGAALFVGGAIALSHHRDGNGVLTTDASRDPRGPMCRPQPSGPPVCP